MSTPRNTLVFIYNSFKDPLFQNLVLTYLKTLSEKTTGKFHIITFEQPQYYINREERKRVKEELAGFRMYWHPMTFHTGRFLLFKKAWDFIRAMKQVIWIRFRHHTAVIFAFANVSAAFSIVFAKLLRMKMIVYSYEPHSAFLAELGFWDPKGAKYRLLNFLEQQAGQRAEYIMTGTQYMVDQLKAEGAVGKLYRAPTAVDADEFHFRKEGRAAVRKMWRIQDKQVFLYVGKFGDLYYTQEIPDMLGEIYQQVPDSHFLIVTSNDQDKIRNTFAKYLPEHSYTITGNLSFEDVKNYISAADIGISGVPPSLSQKYRSPTKVAEYLLCGLPYITTRGVSEDDVWAEREKVGVVVDHFSPEQIQVQIAKLKGLLNEDKSALRERCRRVGLEYRSKERIDSILEEIYKEL